MPDEIDYSKIAWGDESVRMHTDPPMYLLGACVFPVRPNNLLFEIERYRPIAAKKLHWRELGARSQRNSLEAIANNPPKTSLVVASPLIGNKQERARRKCLQELFMQLEHQGVEKLALEGRNEDQNKKDEDFLAYLKRCGTVSQQFRLEHISGGIEPMLEIPDQIIGAYGDLRSAEPPKRILSAWSQIELATTIYEITL